jgi:beta-phosphoglucomutase-like phosphatase (HAD superfamily)
MLLRMLQAVIFDLDGVLADSEPWWNQIDAELLAEFGVIYRGEYHEKVVGVSYRIACEFYKEAFNLSVSVEQMMKRRGEIAAEFFADRVGLFPQTKEVLQNLWQQRLRLGRPVRLGLATSSVSTSARPFLDRHQLTKLFDVIVTGDEVDRGKPAPDIYLRATQKLNIPVDDCLVVEDALSGIAAAKAARIRVAAIPDRRFVDPREYEKHADYVLSDLKELLPLVQKLATS